MLKNEDKNFLMLFEFLNGTREIELLWKLLWLLNYYDVKCSST